MWNNGLPAFLCSAFFICMPADTNGQPPQEPEDIVVVVANPFPRERINLYIRFSPQTYQPRLVALPEAEVAQPISIPAGLLHYLDQQAVTAIDVIDRACELTAEQKQKLLLAASLEQRYLLRQLVRFANEVCEKPLDQLDDAAEVFQQMRIISEAIERGPYRSETFFTNLLETQLSTDQRTELTALHVQWFVDAAARSAVLNTQQRESLRAMVATKAAEIEPIVDRQTFLDAFLPGLKRQDLSELNEQRAILAVMRYMQYFGRNPRAE